MRYLKLFVATIVALVLVSGQVWADSIEWTVRILPADPSWMVANAHDVNDYGVAVGIYATNVFVAMHGVAWSGGSFLDLESIGAAPGATSSVANAVNNSGIVAGNTSSASFLHAALWNLTTSTFSDIHPTVMGFTDSGVLQINNVGQPVGIVQEWTSARTFVRSQAYVWGIGGTPGALLPLPTGMTRSQAGGIGQTGVITGSATKTAFSDPHAVIWTGDLATGYTATDLHAILTGAGGEPGMDATAATGVLSDGTVFGEGRTSSWDRWWAWTWSPTDGVTILPDGGFGSAGSWGVGGPWGVGFVGDWLAPDSAQAAAWRNGMLHILPGLPGYGNMIAIGANYGGVIVGQAMDEGNTFWFQGSDAFIAEPVPEPGTLLLVACGVSLLARRRRSRMR